MTAGRRALQPHAERGDSALSLERTQGESDSRARLGDGRAGGDCGESLQLAGPELAHRAPAHSGGDDAANVRLPPRLRTPWVESEDRREVSVRRRWEPADRRGARRWRAIAGRGAGCMSLAPVSRVEMEAIPTGHAQVQPPGTIALADRRGGQQSRGRRAREGRTRAHTLTAAVGS